MKYKKPHADTQLAKFLTKRILELRPVKTQAEIASQAGFINVNMVAMIKTGQTRLPLDRVSGLAKALQTDQTHLFMLALAQRVGDPEAKAIGAIFERSVTANELDWVLAVREASNTMDPPLTRRGRTAIFSVFGK